MPEFAPSRWGARWYGLLTIALARSRQQLTTARGRTLATVCIVAVTVANLVLATGVALALADDQAIAHDATVQVSPSDSDVQGSVAGVEAPRLGASHARSAAIRERAGVTHATPILAEPLEVASPSTGQSQQLLVVGVLPSSEATIAGLPTDALTSGDPHYADGTYDGQPTGQLVLSTTAADRLDAPAGTQVALTGTQSRSYTVTSVAESPAATEHPVAVVQPSELQSLTDAHDDDLADQVLVWGDREAAQAGGAAAYPTATVETTSRFAVDALFENTLALVTGVLALVIALGLCTLFIAMTAGLTVEANRHTLATLGAVGLPVRSRLVVVAVTTLLLTGCGAVLGVGLGGGAIVAVNALVTATIAPSAVAVFHPLVIPYALGVAAVAALLALPYPLALAARTDILAEVGQ